LGLAAAPLNLGLVHPHDGDAQADAQIQTVVIPAQARGNAKKRANAVDACKKHQPQETSKPEISTGHHQPARKCPRFPPWRGCIGSSALIGHTVGAFFWGAPFTGEEQ
jgi:hypothetical protein